MALVTAKQLDQFLVDGGRLLVIRDQEGKVIECRVEPDSSLSLGLFAIYEKAGLVVPSTENFYAISPLGKIRIQRSYTRDARFTKRKRLVTGGNIRP